MIGSNIKLLRNRKGKSQEEVATKLMLTRSSYSGYENEVAQPSIETLILISSYFENHSLYETGLSLVIEKIYRKDGN